MRKDVKVFVVNSAKGGVGKTRTAKAIAQSLLQKGKTVSVFDLDVTTPNVDKMDGIKVYSHEAKQMPTKTGIRKFIKKSFADSDAEYVIVDTPPTISEMYLSISSYIREATFLFITTRDENAVKDTAIGMRYFAMYGIGVDNVILNMADVFEGLSSDQIEESLSANIISTVDKGGDLEEVVSFMEAQPAKKFHLTNTDGSPLLNKLSKITVEEVERDGKIPLRFYNLETWELIRERIMGREFLNSYLNVSASQIAPFLEYEEDECVYVRILKEVSVSEKFLPFEIVKCYITMDASVSRGMPMLVTMSGTHLWIGEVGLVSDREIADIISDGGYDTGSSILFDFFNQMYMFRAFVRSDLQKERSVIKLWEKKTGVEVSKKDKIFTIAVLEKEASPAEYEDFAYESYINMQEGDFKDHLVKIVEGA